MKLESLAKQVVTQPDPDQTSTTPAVRSYNEYGDLNVEGQMLSTLAGLGFQDIIIERDFECGNNFLTSLEGCPKIVKRDFDCNDNKLVSLKDIHKHVHEIGGNIYLEGNQITSHVLGLLKIKRLRAVRMSNNPNIEQIINRHLRGGRNLLACQEEMMDAGLDDFAQL